MTDNTFFEAFLTLHRGLPRQGPGSDATTRRLLSLAGPLPERPRVLDLGCGPGRSALLLAAEAGAEVTAVDIDAGFLDELGTAAEARGLAGRVHPVRADMTALPFPDGSFDLVWAESSVFVVGFDTALREWRRLLAPGGTLVLTECVWTADEPSAAASAFWDEHYPLRRDAQNTAAAEAAGYRVLGVHPQPASDWDEYYGPLAAAAAGADRSAPGMAAAAAGAEREIAMRRDHGHEYGYSGYVLRPAGPDGWLVREERAADRAAVHAVHAAAFPTRSEADLVDALRADPAWVPGFSYVAQAPDGSVAAHALVTRCRIGGAPALALAPVATAPEFQGTGAGSAVVRAVLDAVRRRGEPLVLVLGHPGYYPRFGFEPAAPYGITLPFEVPEEASMVLVLDGSAPVPSGMIAYPAPFGV
ncbi:bifunctional class I SAM-dependent methyltransferase/N-acetyltransferase [Streptomyces bambusae]|uniref:bifunctional class I SAM-dependent methyltransferase/N-acetyltransferase n=1 Tax=Streptomyces bambusae TaxID=1550616 RepID=UPI001CFE2E49|nr:bifunctional class I SAM-dependent methyltransferase/N-acetyltransferase [Streptomyces bambusae]MCB5164024.1 bifunctional class I SAM-dependent methyltransferase/N-acetyltransferase [Streptomyces bambusae]